MHSAFGSLLLSVPAQPPWPDPPSVIPFGYARRWCNHRYPRHHRRFGRIDTFCLPDFSSDVAFLPACLFCFSALGACCITALLCMLHDVCVSLSSGQSGIDHVTIGVDDGPLDDPHGCDTDVGNPPKCRSPLPLDVHCWQVLRPFQHNIIPFVRFYFDWELLYRYEVHAPPCDDADQAEFVPALKFGLTWRLRRRIKRIEAKLRHQDVHPSQFPSPLSPPEPPPFVHEAWCTSFESPWVILARLPRPLSSPSPPIGVWWESWVEPTWDELVDDILADVIPSDIALINFMGTASFDVEDKLK